MARTLPFKLRHIAAALALVVAVIVIWGAYQSVVNTTDPSSQTLPIIRADREPFRVLPEDPGGVEIPNQGSRLFNVLNAENADELALSGITIEQAETIQPDITPNDEAQGFALPEIPEPTTESLFAEIETLKDQEVIESNPALEVMTEDDKQELQEILKTELEVLAVEDIPVEPVEVVEEQEEEKVIATVSVLPAQKPQPPVRKVREDPAKQDPPKQFSLDRILAQDPVKDDVHYIQLATVKTEADARAAYARLRDSFPALVAGVGSAYPSVDLGSRGVFTRVQIGPLSKAEANKRCADYRAKAGGGTCLVVAR